MSELSVASAIRPAITSVMSAGSSVCMAVGPSFHCSAMPTRWPTMSKIRPVTFWAASLHSHAVVTAIQRGPIFSWVSSSIPAKPGRSLVMRV